MNGVVRVKWRCPEPDEPTRVDTVGGKASGGDRQMRCDVYG